MHGQKLAYQQRATGNSGCREGTVQSRATWPVKWYISTAVLPALPDDSQSEMMLTSHYGLSYLVTDKK